TLPEVESLSGGHLTSAANG
ncbi:hypothetical protein A2U01_0063415, partial [Trifolium medium]|nr:hypothetical protein [Trifolium medium]